jgi:uncharacterized membrane protein
VQRIVAKYGIDYIIAGLLERQAYGDVSLQKFDNLYPVAFKSGDITVYKVTEQRGQ